MAEHDRHPLRQVLDEAARGGFPPADGAVETLPPDADGTRAVLALTGHAYVMTDAGAAEVLSRAPEGGFGATVDPAFLIWLAGDTHRIGTLDVLLVREATGREADRLPLSTDFDHHPRVRLASRQRREVAVFADPHGVVVLGEGLVGRREMSIELFAPEQSPPRAGRRLIAAGLAAAPKGEPIWAQIAPGNARSLRAALAAGFRPVGAEVLLFPRAVE